MNRGRATRVERSQYVLQNQVILKEAARENDFLLMLSRLARVHLRQMCLQLLHRPAPLTMDRLVVVLLIGSLDDDLHGRGDAMVGHAPIAGWRHQIFHNR